jgi:hypothetical protein
VSRSNPNENGIPNPSTRWFEWNGEKGVVRYYDKETQQNVEVGTDFTFLMLDQLGKVGGWHDASDSAIYSNEVKDTRQDVLIVKSFKGGIHAEGIYKDIKDRVGSIGGSFIASCYIAYKRDDGLAIGNIGFKGAALHAWSEFAKANRANLYKKAVRIKGYTEGQKGRVVYRVPQFALVDTTPETDKVAIALDAELQAFLKHYLTKNKRDQVEATPAPHVGDEQVGESFGTDDYWQRREPVAPAVITDDDIPF